MREDIQTSKPMSKNHTNRQTDRLKLETNGKESTLTICVSVRVFTYARAVSNRTLLFDMWRTLRKEVTSNTYIMIAVLTIDLFEKFCEFPVHVPVLSASVQHTTSSSLGRR